MPSTVVHLALAGLLAAGLLGSAFGPRALLVVLAATAVPDLDAFVSLAIESAHRAAFHTFLFPIALAMLVWYDTRYRERSWLRSHWHSAGIRIAWVSIVAMAVAGIGLDLFANGVNVLYPIHDQFYKLDGKILLSNQEGLVQTFVDLSSPVSESGGGTSGGGTEVAVGSTEQQFYSTGVNPWRRAESGPVERVFPIVRSGQQALLVVASAIVVGGRLLEQRLSSDSA